MKKIILAFLLIMFISPNIVIASSNNYINLVSEVDDYIDEIYVWYVPQAK